MDNDLLPGRSYPLGATMREGGVNFCVFSRNSTAMELLLFDHYDSPAPARVIRLDPQRNRSFYYWHIFIKGLHAGQLYAYRAHGPFIPEKGLRFDGEKVLIDPYAYAVMYAGNYDRQQAQRPGDNCAHAMKSVVIDLRGYHWEGDTPIDRPVSRSIIYELHVAGFTRHPSSGVDPAKRGTYLGLIEKIPYLKELGVTAVELLPVQQFDEQEAPPGLTNYWGYNPVALFAPHRGYSMGSDPLAPVNEFRDMVKAFHRADMEVILDVVFNHTAEGDQNGPTLSMRGLENRAYYILDRKDPSTYTNYSGCGNSLNANHSIVRRMIIDCLRYWVQGLHVDGFRFDLASVLSRDETGRPLKDPPILWEIESDPILAGTRIIAEAWDAAGLYQVGAFIGHRWGEWNGKYRDDVRRFVKSDPGTVAALAERIAGSRDIYPQAEREPTRSINFITCHDGFTLYDLVSYNTKHNQLNRLDNTDGANENFSWNCGIEGPTDDPKILTLRASQVRNLLTILILSQGTPMLSMGDEVCRTQNGNNNPFCQDNEISWFDWNLVNTNQHLLQFVRSLIQFRQQHNLFHCPDFWTEPEGPEIYWHGVQLDQPDWGHDSHSLAFELTDPDTGDHFYVALNAYWHALAFELPPLKKAQWGRLFDTSLPPGEDFRLPGVRLKKSQRLLTVQPRSVVVLKKSSQ
ncbi:MAG: glycogen debranching protein GlgX [Anaerolineales bacterium]|nr:glycogen debranching protein GlgX [Anaerolineales bacterium]